MKTEKLKISISSIGKDLKDRDYNKDRFILKHDNNLEERPNKIAQKLKDLGFVNIVKKEAFRVHSRIYLYIEKGE